MAAEFTSTQHKENTYKATGLQNPPAYDCYAENHRYEPQVLDHVDDRHFCQTKKP